MPLDHAVTLVFPIDLGADEALRVVEKLRRHSDGVATAAQTPSRGVQESRSAAGELARMSNELQALVNGFRV